MVVTKMRSLPEVDHIYGLGQRDFAENRVQSLLEKYEALPKDIDWHLIGSLQTNKVKYIAPFIKLIHSLDDTKLWTEIDKQANKCNRTISCLLQIKIAQEESKSGFDWDKLLLYLNQNEWKKYPNVNIIGVMGMATLTDDHEIIQEEFNRLKDYFDTLKARFFNFKSFEIISMGMSGDYKLAIEAGSTMVRIGSAIFEL